MEVYLVGGAVRDELLGLPAGDRDWVVVGSTPDAMVEAGYRQVGRDFPVFLHPDSAEEYALARTERKTGPGHQGFVCHAGPEVTLEQDLERRDLTINAMARDAQGALRDPFQGQRDLLARRLRHVSPSFTEDPLRLFRVARFAARLPGFEVADETLALMRAMAARGDLDELSAERVWQELHKALNAPAPQRFFEVIADAEAFEPWLAELAAPAPAVPAGLDGALSRYVALTCPREPSAVARLSQRLRAPKRYALLAEQGARHGWLLARWREADAGELQEVLKRLQAFKTQTDLAPLWAGLGAAYGCDLTPLAELVAVLKTEVTAASMDPSLSGAALGRAIERRRTERLAAAQSR